MSDDTTRDELTLAHLLIDNHGAHKARELRKWILARRAEGCTVKMIDPKGDGTGSNE